MVKVGLSYEEGCYRVRKKWGYGVDKIGRKLSVKNVVLEGNESFYKKSVFFPLLIKKML